MNFSLHNKLKIIHLLDQIVSDFQRTTTFAVLSLPVSNENFEVKLSICRKVDGDLILIRSIASNIPLLEDPADGTFLNRSNTSIDLTGYLSDGDVANAIASNRPFPLLNHGTSFIELGNRLDEIIQCSLDNSISEQEKLIDMIFEELASHNIIECKINDIGASINKYLQLLYEHNDKHLDTERTDLWFCRLSIIEEFILLIKLVKILGHSFKQCYADALPETALKSLDEFVLNADESIASSIAIYENNLDKVSTKADEIEEAKTKLKELIHSNAEMVAVAAHLAREAFVTSKIDILEEREFELKLDPNAKVTHAGWEEFIQLAPNAVKDLPTAIQNLTRVSDLKSSKKSRMF